MQVLELEKSGGFVKIYRKLLDSPLWIECTPERKTILITMILLANHSEKNVMLKTGEIVKVERGQFITSYRSLAEKCGKGITKNHVESALRFFKKAQFCRHEPIQNIRQGNRQAPTLVTIENWTMYQNNFKTTDNTPDNTQDNNKDSPQTEQEYKEYKEYNNMSDSKESDHSPGAFKDSINTNKTTKSSKTKRATKVFEENSIEYQLSKKLYQYVLEEKPKTRKPDLQKWSKDFDLILRRDERSLEDLENVIDWIFNGDSNSSNFWKKNISSPGALRGTTKNGADKFAEIYSQMENDTNYYRPLQKELEKELPPITAEEFYDI